MNSQGSISPTVRSDSAICGGQVELSLVQSEETLLRLTGTVQSWGNQQVVGGVPEAESHGCRPKHDAVREKPDQNCSSGEQSSGRSHQDAEEEE